MSIFPPTFSDVLTVNYYDNYVNLGFSPPTKVLEQDTAENTKGMATASYIRILNQSKWEMTYTVYDKKSRPIGTYKTNYLGGYTHVETLLNFRGLPIKTETKHKRDPNGIEITVIDHFEYDSQERLLWHIQKINEETPQMIAFNTYDELGQLINKKVCGTAAQSIDQERWQSIDYRYNIRGWLTDINTVDDVIWGKGKLPPKDKDDLFAFKIAYDRLYHPSDFAQRQYNGNIAQTYWRSGSDDTTRGYDYSYDMLNRLRNAEFSDGIEAPYKGAYNENIGYDLNGNITSLLRTDGDFNGDRIEMDELVYSYKDRIGNSNILLNVTDNVSTQDSFGFIDGNTNPALDDYEYDENGNMIKDRNKGINQIIYNHLNLPVRVEWSANEFILYQYNAAGQKLTKTVRDNDSIKIVRYLDGFQYAGDILQFFPTTEGYVKATPVGNANPDLPPTGYAYNYTFNYTDHLGNIRLSYTKDPQSGTLQILEENQYYPFGLRHGVYDTGGKKDFSRNPGDGIEPEPGLPPVLDYVTRMEYQYKYNGKELQDELGLSWYDYGARNYDATIGRWMNVDPLAEKKPNWTPYRYAFNNPNFFTDPNGMLEDYIDINQETGDITVTKAAGDDQVRLVDNDGNVVKNDYGKEQSYTYGENGSFSKENTISRSGGQTRITSTNPQKAFQFFRFAAKSSVEFGFVRWTSNSNGLQRATVLTNHSKGSIRLNSYMSEILRNNAASRISEYWHSHPAPNPIYSYNNHPSGFTIWGEPDGDELGNGDRQAFDEMQRKFPGRVPSNANIYSDYFNTKTTYNNESFFIHTNYSGGSLMLNSDIGL